MIYFKAALTAVSPLIIGSGAEDNSDKDVCLDADERPYIPATALAGVCRHYFPQSPATDEIFGKQLLTKEDKGVKSKIIFYDAVCEGDSPEVPPPAISLRDSVKLGEYRIAEDGAKFDYEIVEAGAKFVFRMEYDGAWEVIKKIVEGINSGDILLGAKTTRGFGRLKVDMDTAKILEIDLDKEIDKYINFKWADVTGEYNALKPVPIARSALYETLVLDFSVSSYLFIRNYATLAVADNGKFVDAEQLTDNNGRPVISGAAWAGVFRHHFARVLKKAGYAPNARDLENNLFGIVEEDGKKMRSRIIFSDSVIESATLRNRTRTAVDRFTGGAGDGLLFTTRPAYGGGGTLEIKLPKGVSNGELIKSVINVCVEDINEGFLNIGGESSVGAGFLKVTKRGDWT
ncbi:MAG: RAMP superfamily CRISPR-associated protein [Clostridiales bacterium]|jgi:CRISPR/Cas system CSM-associated protein Csm3 (group 7 of RAMP superfamily)|nr:RAMP superfamily CRISPR-associated protein [Clostridiales bacterium]